MNTTPGTRLRHLRELLGYAGRQQEFALAVGLTQQSISNMERDKTEPAAKSLQKLFSAFPQVNLSWLVTGAGRPLATAGLTGTAPAPVLAPVAAPVLAPAADVLAQFLALLAEREAALKKEHRAAAALSARAQQFTVERMEKALDLLESEVYYLRGLLGHRPPSAEELALQQQQAAAAKGRPAGFKNYDAPAPQPAVAARAARGHTSFPRLPSTAAAGFGLLRPAA